MTETISSPAFQQGLFSAADFEGRKFGRMEDVYEFQKIQEREKALIGDYQLAQASGKLSKAQVTSYNKKFTQLGTDYAALGTEFIPSQLNEEYFKDIDPARKEMLRAAARQGAAEATGKIPGILPVNWIRLIFAQDYMRMSGQLEKDQFQHYKNFRV